MQRHKKAKIVFDEVFTICLLKFSSEWFTMDLALDEAEC